MHPVNSVHRSIKGVISVTEIEVVSVERVVHRLSPAQCVLVLVVGYGFNNFNTVF